jgi:DDE family transposase
MVVVIDVEPIRERFLTVAPFLDERGRRLVAAAEAFAAGYGGIAAVAMATGMAPSTIGRGLRELAQDEPSERIRRPGAGRKPTICKDPTLLADLEALVEPTTRGDPDSPLRWTCKSVRRLAQALQAQGHQVSRTLVAELLNAAGYSLQANRKTNSTSLKTLDRVDCSRPVPITTRRSKRTSSGLGSPIHGSLLTPRWREPDSNHRSRVRKSGRCQVPAIRPGSVEH